MSAAIPLDVNQRLALARAQMLRGWWGGICPDVEQVLRDHPLLQNDAAAVADLVHVEVVLRQARGAPFDADSVCQRFPAHAEAIRWRLALDRGLWSENPTIAPGPSRDGGATLAPDNPVVPNASEQILTALPADEEYPRVPGYEILGELGRGGMGVVYRARHVKLHREVALKMILAGAAGEMDRFRLEAEALARLQHHGIVQIHEIGEVDLGSGAPCPYFSLEFCPGGSLAGKLDPYRDPRAAAGLVRTLALAMHAVHGKGIIHRDLKPGNVLIAEDGSPKITDFGLARMAQAGESGKTRTGAVMGTPSYMSPEQAAGRTHDLGPACDVYALGAILYECLTGRPPFQGPTVLDTLMMVMEQEPVPPRQIHAAVAADLETICLKCLEKEARNRYGTAAALAGDLGRFLADEPIQARPPGLIARLNRQVRKDQVLVIAYGIALFMAVVAFSRGWLPAVTVVSSNAPILMALPLFIVVVQLPLQLGSGWLRATAVAFLLASSVGSSVTARTGLGAGLFQSFLFVSTPLSVLVLLAGFGRARGIRELVGLVFAGVAASALLLWSVRSGPIPLTGTSLYGVNPASILRMDYTAIRNAANHALLAAKATILLAVISHAIALGFLVAIVSWALRRKKGAILLGGLIGMVVGLTLAERYALDMSNYLMTTSGLRRWTPAILLLYLELALAYAGALVAGLLAPIQGRGGSQDVPSRNNTRRSLTSTRWAAPGKPTTN